MRYVATLLTFTSMAVQTLANVNYIDFSKISTDRNLSSAFDYIRDNQQYYDHWTNNWNYNKPKEELINKLNNYFESFSTITTKNEEMYLLLGDIAHYLYNMDDAPYYSIAVSNYEKAIESSTQDYRGYWFLAYHYALSNVPTLAIDAFVKAQDLLPIDEPADFWNEYAWAAAVTNMPSHCVYAMDKVKSISGEEGSFESQLGPSIYKRVLTVDKDKDYSKQDVWTASQGNMTTFTSRPLGIKILVDSTWDVSIYDYHKHQCTFIIKPPSIQNRNGREIDYTMAILMKTADDDNTLDNYISTFVAAYTNKKRIIFSDRYNKMIAYEIRDSSMYQDIGGGHLYMLGIERSSPKYPGLLLENPATMPEGNSKVAYYAASDSNGRFEGKIFYAIMLDSCEDINEQSLDVFKSLFDNQIIIE